MPFVPLSAVLVEAWQPFVPMTWGATPDLLAGNLRGAFETIMRDKAVASSLTLAKLRKASLNPLRTAHEVSTPLLQ